MNLRVLRTSGGVRDFRVLSSRGPTLSLDGRGRSPTPRVEPRVSSTLLVPPTPFPPPYPFHPVEGRPRRPSTPSSSAEVAESVQRVEEIRSPSRSYSTLTLGGEVVGSVTRTSKIAPGLRHGSGGRPSRVTRGPYRGQLSSDRPGTDVRSSGSRSFVSSTPDSGVTRGLGEGVVDEIGTEKGQPLFPGTDPKPTTPDPAHSSLSRLEARPLLSLPTESTPSRHVCFYTCTHTRGRAQQQHARTGVLS